VRGEADALDARLCASCGGAAALDRAALDFRDMEEEDDRAIERKADRFRDQRKAGQQWTGIRRGATLNAQQARLFHCGR
jgi:hypothetical protein